MIPLGLILNELLTNAFKYVFEQKEEGNIWVSIHETSQGLSVTVRDDGIGMVGGQVQKGFGSRLINAFLKKLEAEASTAYDGGTCFSMLIKQYQSSSLKAKSA
jgi:two-component sensor histidine kinase